MPNVALFVAFVTATREARKKHGETKAPTIVHCRLEMENHVIQPSVTKCNRKLLF